MNICIIATASRASGALTIYRQFIESLMNNFDEDAYYVFVDQSMPKPVIQNVEYIEYNTRGWRRIMFDFFCFHREMLKRRVIPDVIVSFQNTGVRSKCTNQIIYYHNPFISVNKSWNVFDKQQRIPFFYAKLYPMYVKSLFRGNTRIVVQANFMKDSFIKTFHVSTDKITVIHPDVSIPDITNVIPYQFESNTIDFLYPAIPSIYKNHILLVNALSKLKFRNADLVNRIRIHLTFKKADNEHLSSEILRCGLEKQFVMHGSIDYEVLLSMYKSCRGLLFPSYMETLGVPLLEAAKFGKPIIVCDCPYSHETISGYSGIEYVGVDDVCAWTEKIANLCEESKTFPCYDTQCSGSWDEFFTLIKS